MTPGDSSSFTAPLPIGRIAKSLPEQVAEQISAIIEQGGVEPGQRLKEELLAEQFAVSRSSVREAIAILERRGLVERVPRYGTRVRKIDQAEVEEIFAIRSVLLGLAARQVTDAANPAALQQFQATCERLRRMAADPTTAPASYGQASVGAQRQLITLAGGRQLPALYEALGNQSLWLVSVRGRALSFLTQERRLESANDWTELAAQIQSGNANAAETQAKALLHRSLLAVREQWEAHL